MATNWAVEDAKMTLNNEFIKIAEELKSSLIKTKVEPLELLVFHKGMRDYKVYPVTELNDRTWVRGDSFILDFGHHGVGYLSFECKSVGSPQDAPAFLKLKFCEVSREFAEESSGYEGWISKGWIQEEWLHMDVLPAEIALERRYAFRYLKVDILDTSQKFKIAFQNFIFEKVSAVTMETVPLIETRDNMLISIDKAALRTLQDCMQTVFEDGPKRDRRLWLGDLRLQALVNYVTFQNYDLVKRCLYLFAGLPREDGMIAACIFTEPEPLMDDSFLLDYSLFFLSTLLDYYSTTKDELTLRDLSPIAFKQMELALTYFDENFVIGEEGKYHCFIDWNNKLNKQCSMQAVYLYTLKDAIKLSKYLKDTTLIHKYEERYDLLKRAALTYLWDEERQVFISGKEQQVSIASQIWMIEAGLMEGKEGAALLERVKDSPIKMVTPYMNHFYLEALIKCGEFEKAKRHMVNYWGSMILEGADTFWELFNPDNLSESPYGSSIVNSYCHAWSCTPSYFMRIYGDLI